MKLKHFNQQGRLYTMKRQYGFGILLISGLLLLAFGAYFVGHFGFMSVMLVLGILCFLALAAKKMIIDMDERMLYAKVGLAKPPIKISIDNIKRLELFTMSNNFFKTNVILSAYYLDENNNEKSIQIAQSFTVNTIQSILNEMEEIIGNER